MFLAIRRLLFGDPDDLLARSRQRVYRQWIKFKA
jgi:hypothetical protein